jgi:hypothetical protein
LLPGDFSPDSKMQRTRGIVLSDDIKAVLKNLVNQASIMSTRSLKINHEEHMKVLKKVVKSCRDDIAAGCQKAFQQDGKPVHRSATRGMPRSSGPRRSALP